MSPDGFDDVNLSKIADGQIHETLELSDLISQKSEAGANPDQVCEIIRMTCVSYGFPDCGHLFSNQKKDVQQRVKCIEAMLTQRKQDIDFRLKMKDESKAIDADQINILKSKLDRFKNSIKKLDNEN